MSSADGNVGPSSADSTMRVIQSVKLSPAQVRGVDGARVPDELAAAAPLLRYLGWSSARVNYRGAAVSCVAKDGRRNIVVLSCPMWRSAKSFLPPSHSSTVLPLRVQAERLPGVKRSLKLCC